MAHPVDNAFSRTLEILILAITFGCSAWIAFIASGLQRFLANL